MIKQLRGLDTFLLLLFGMAWCYWQGYKQGKQKGGDDEKVAEI